jgi:hypothetical protein
MEAKKTCPKCKTIRFASDFEIKRLDMPFKTCKKCRETEDKYRSKKTLLKNSKWKFVENLLKLSESDTYEEAIKEWEIIYATEDIESKCICTHIIHEVFHMQNNINNYMCDVGNCCVLKFGDKNLNKNKNFVKNKFITSVNRDKEGIKTCKYCFKKLRDDIYEDYVIFHKSCFKEYVSQEKNENTFIITFGKHKGKSYIDLKNKEPKYIEWLLNQTPNDKSPIYFFQRFVKSLSPVIYDDNDYNDNDPEECHLKNTNGNIFRKKIGNEPPRSDIY